MNLSHGFSCVTELCVCTVCLIPLPQRLARNAIPIKEIINKERTVRFCDGLLLDPHTEAFETNQIQSHFLTRTPTESFQADCDILLINRATSSASPNPQFFLHFHQP